MIHSANPLSRRQLLSTVSVCLLIPIIGCSAGRAEDNRQLPNSVHPVVSRESPHGKMLICLFDETASYAAQPGLWEDSVQKAASAADELNAGDSFMALAITDKGWRSQDERIKLRMLTSTSLLVMRERSSLKADIRNLKVAETSSGFMKNGKAIGKPEGTDLLGAVDYAAFLARSAGNRAVTIILFTDLEDEKKKGIVSYGQTLQTFPQFTHITAINVRPTGAEDTKNRIDRWCNTLNSMKNPGSDDVVSPDDFHMIGQTNEVTSFFKWARR